MANGTCPCNGVVGNLISHITPYLQALNIFDTGNVFVYYVDITIQSNQKVILNLISVYGSIAQQPGIYIIVANSHNLQCKQSSPISNIIYIGSSGNLLQRHCSFIQELIGNYNGNRHSGAKRIKDTLLQRGITQTCLYVIGLPLKPQYNQQVERCFQDVFINYYGNLPCCLKQHANVQCIFNSPNPKQTIEDLLRDIDNIFNNCIQHC